MYVKIGHKTEQLSGGLPRGVVHSPYKWKK